MTAKTLEQWFQLIESEEVRELAFKHIDKQGWSGRNDIFGSFHDALSSAFNWHLHPGNDFWHFLSQNIK